MLPQIPDSAKRQVYLDHAATTPVDPRVVAAMRPYWSEDFGNPSALYSLGQDSKRAIRQSRQIIADHLSCLPEEIIFTPSGTASDNLAILGVARNYAPKGKHLISSTIEHHAVLKTLEHLERKEGFTVTYVGVDGEGIINPEDVIKAIQPDTTLISIMLANNEIGTIQPIAEIGQLLKKVNKSRVEDKLPKVYFHTDACQAAGALSLDVKNLGVDLLTFNGSKIYGPKGIGALFVMRGVQLTPLIFGGGQERNLVSGTESVADIVGLATAFDIAQKEKSAESERLRELRDYLIAGVLSKITKCRLNGDPVKRLPNNANLTVLDVEGEAVLLYLNEYGISSATGSACDSETLDPSHVILALGLPYEFAHGSLRFTLGRSTTKEDIDYLLGILPPIVETLREISPVKLELDPEQNQHGKILQHASNIKAVAN